MIFNQNFVGDGAVAIVDGAKYKPCLVAKGKKERHAKAWIARFLGAHQLHRALNSTVAYEILCDCIEHSGNSSRTMAAKASRLLKKLEMEP